MNLKDIGGTRAGFTMIEMIFVIVIGAILMSIMLSGLQSAREAIASREATRIYATLHQKARARSIELGETVLLHVDTNGDSAYIEDGGGVSDVTRFRQQLNVDLRATPSVFFLCMTPRGYADPDCPALGTPATTDSQISLEFWLGADSSTIRILPLGQLAGL